MKFRQRVAWLLIVFYLAGTYLLTKYYLFDVHEQYKRFAVEHDKKYHHPDTVRAQRIPEVNHENSQMDNQQVSAPVASHISDVPISVLMLLISLPYLQVFCLLFACTKLEPTKSLALVWPCVLYRKCEYMVCPGTPSLKSDSLQNGHPLVET